MSIIHECMYRPTYWYYELNRFDKSLNNANCPECASPTNNKRFAKVLGMVKTLIQRKPLPIVEKKKRRGLSSYVRTVRSPISPRRHAARTSATFVLNMMSRTKVR